MVFLYRRPLLDYWAEGNETLGHLVTHVLVHEIGHHFGLSDADMAHIEARPARAMIGSPWLTMCGCGSHTYPAPAPCSGTCRLQTGRETGEGGTDLAKSRITGILRLSGRRQLRGPGWLSVARRSSLLA